MWLFIPRKLEFVLQPDSGLGKKGGKTSAIGLIGTKLLHGIFEGGGEVHILLSQVLTLGSCLFEQLRPDFSELLIRLLVKLLHFLGRHRARGLDILTQHFDGSPTLRGFRAQLFAGLFLKLPHFLSRHFAGRLEVLAHHLDRDATLRGLRANPRISLFLKLPHLLSRHFAGGLKVSAQSFDRGLTLRGLRAYPFVERVNFLLGVGFEGIESFLQILAQFSDGPRETILHASKMSFNFTSLTTKKNIPNLVERVDSSRS